MNDYIPKDEANRLIWLTNFSNWVNLNGLTHGFTAAEISALSNASAEAATAVGVNATAQANARAATIAKNTALGDAIALARADAQRLQSWPTTTDEDRAAAGITVPDSDSTSTPGDQVLTVAPPLLLLDFSVRRQVTVHWGPNPSNELKNGRPAGVIGCQVQAARGGIPAEEALWIPIDTDTESPLIHLVNETAPVTFAYRARYVGKNLKYGPYGDPVVCTVSV